MDRITVVITTYNEEREVLRKTIDSVLDQEDVVVSLVVSSVMDDKNYDFLSGYRNIAPIFIEKEDHPGYGPEGSFFQLNRATDNARNSDYFCFFSGNDIMRPNYTKLCIDVLKDSDKEVAYTDFLRVKPQMTTRLSLRPYSREAHQLGNIVPDTAVITKKMMNLLPFRSEELGNLAFYDFWLRIYEKHGDVFQHIALVGWEYLIKETSMHIKRKKNEGWYEKQKQERQEFLKLHPLQKGMH